MIQAEVLTIDHIIVKNGEIFEAVPIDTLFTLKLETIYPMYVLQCCLI